MSFVVLPREAIHAPVLGRAETFPIRRIYCVGRNYAAHAREMGADLREPPCFFVKDADAYAPSGGVVPYPPATSDYHYETELVVAIGAEGFDVAPEAANRLIFGYAVGLDMTRRDLQSAAKKAGLPWDTGKNFPGAAPLGALDQVYLSVFFNTSVESYRTEPYVFALRSQGTGFEGSGTVVEGNAFTTRGQQRMVSLAFGTRGSFARVYSRDGWTYTDPQLPQQSLWVADRDAFIRHALGLIGH